MMVLFMLQLVVPLLMLLCLATFPPASRLGVGLLLIAASAWLIAIGWSGVWTVLPWWTPRGLGIAIAAMAAWRFAGFRRLPTIPSGSWGWIGISISLIVALIASSHSVGAIRGHLEPTGPFAEIRNPMREGTYLVVNGGGSRAVNAHLKTLSGDEPQFRAWRGQSYGIDLIRISDSGFRARGLRPPDPSAYAGFGSPVLAPCTGSIVQAKDGIEDNEVPRTNRGQMAGNHVIVRCDGFDIVLAHLRRGSVAVRSGDRVTVGDGIGELGNSGNSDEPHLHVHAQRFAPMDAPFSAEPVPLRIDGRYLVRNDRIMLMETKGRARAPTSPWPDLP